MTRLILPRCISFVLNFPLSSILQQTPHQRWLFSGHGFFHLEPCGPDTRPTPQLQPFLTAAALVVAQAGACLTGLVAGLAFSQLLVSIEARATILHTVATREKEALLTPVALMLVAAAAVSATGSAFPFLTEGLLRAGFITMSLKHVISCSTQGTGSWIIHSASQTAFLTGHAFVIFRILEFTLSALQLLAGVVGGHDDVATGTSTAGMWAVAKLTVVWAG